MPTSRLAPALLALTLAATPLAAETPPADAAAKNIATYLAPYEAANHLSGRLLVLHGDTVLYDDTFGYANHELRAPVTPTTRFNIASITKPMTVTVLIALATEGKLAMEDPLSRWIPGFPRGDEITVGHLARHRAGIPHRVTEACDETVPHTAQDMVEFAAKRPLTGEPGAEHVYSSGGFAVLARVLELAGGRSYEELLQQHVFGPAGMTRSAHVDARALLDGRAAGYVPAADGGLRNPAFQDFSFLVGAGSVWSTADDLAALLRAVRTGALGEGARQSFVDEKGIDWNGSTGGFRAFADWHRESDVTVIFTGNLQSGAVNRLRKDLPRIAAGESVPPPVLPDVTPIDVPAATLARWQGDYELRPGSPLNVHLDGDALYVNDWVLIPTGPRRFFSPQDWADIEVVLDDAGKPLRLDWVVDGTPYPCPRAGDLQ